LEVTESPAKKKAKADGGEKGEKGDKKKKKEKPTSNGPYVMGTHATLEEIKEYPPPLHSLPFFFLFLFLFLFLASFLCRERGYERRESGKERARVI
jgi:hypothetical protein